LKPEKSDFLLNKERLNGLIKNLNLEVKPKKDDIYAMLTRCQGMKILIKALEDHGQDLVKLIDKDFYKSFLKELYEEACTPETGSNNLQCEWLEQKIYAL
jgi:hypothetical protein